MNKKAIIPLVLGLGIGLLAVKFGVDAIRQAQASGENKTTVTVVKAKQDINAFDLIEPNMVEVIEAVDSPFAPASERFDDTEKVVGRVAGKGIPRGAPVLKSMLAPDGTQPYMAGRIKEGYRAVSVKIDETTGVAYQLRPGVNVDVTVVMDVDTGRGTNRGRKETVSETILQRVEIGAVGYGSQSDGENSLDKVKPAKSATLLVKRNDVPKLHLAQTKGKITLSLVPETDDGVAEVAAAGEDDLMSGSNRSDQGDEGILAKVAQMIAANNAPDEQNPPQRRADVPTPPVGVMVFHHSSIEGDDSVVEQAVFKDPKSARLLHLQLGAPTRADGAMRGDGETGTHP